MNRSAIAALLLWMVSVPVLAQGTNSAFNPRDDHFVILGLVRVRSEYERVEKELNRARALGVLGFLSPAEVEAREAEFARVRVDYLQQALAAMSATTHVTVDRAIKRRHPSGGSTVLITLRSAGGELELATLGAALDTALQAQLRPDVIENVFISLRSDVGTQGVGISTPYEILVPRLNRSQRATVSFKLLRDVEELVTVVSYGGRTDERRIALEPEAGAEAVAVQSIQFSQEADLGTEATFDLRLRRSIRDRNSTVALSVANLPREASYEFRDPSTKARVTQVRFPDAEPEQLLQFIVKLPYQESERVKVDQALRFAVLVLPANDAGAPADSQPATGQHALGQAHLELVPRGTAKADVRADNLFHEVRSGDSVRVQLTIRNSGSRRLDGVRVVVDAPSEWKAHAVPDAIASMREGDTRQVDVMLVSPPTAAIGDYEVRIRIASSAQERGLTSDEKIVRVHVSAGNRTWLLAGLAVMAGVVVIVMIRVTMRLAQR